MEFTIRSFIPASQSFVPSYVILRVIMNQAQCMCLNMGGEEREALGGRGIYNRLQKNMNILEHYLFISFSKAFEKQRA